MPTSELWNLLNLHKDEIAHKAAERLWQAAYDQTEVTVKQLMAGYMLFVNRAIEYLQTGDLDLYRNFMVDYAEVRHKAGISIEQLIMGGDLLFEEMHKIVDIELPDDSLRQKYQRRIESIRTLAYTTARNVYLRNQNIKH